MTVNKLQGVDFDHNNCQFFKTYEEDTLRIPLNMVVKRRDVNHYLNVNPRTSTLDQSIKKRQQSICLNMKLFGVMGVVDKIDKKKWEVKVNFDREAEENKLHDPFVAQNLLH